MTISFKIIKEGTGRQSMPEQLEILGVVIGNVRNNMCGEYRDFNEGDMHK